MFTLKAEIKLWPTSESPWHYLEIPKDTVNEIMKLPLDRGLKKVTAKLEDYEWKTSIMPAGEGRKILPINAKVRKDLNLSLGDTLDITIAPLDI